MIPIIEAGLAILDKLIPDPVARQAAKVRLWCLHFTNRFGAIRQKLPPY